MVATAWEKLQLLMWKNFLQQWRHKLQSVAEVLLPVLTASLVIILRVEIDPVQYDTISYPPIPASSLLYSQAILAAMDGNVTFAYSPESPILEEITRAAAAQVMLREIPVTGYRDLTDLFLEPGSTSKVIAAVQFNDSLAGATSLPDVIHYSLRFPFRPRQSLFFSQGSWSWRTGETFPFYPSPGPRASGSWEGGNNPGYVNEMFVAFQHAISMQLIATKAPDAAVAAAEVDVQRYPHPAYTADAILGALQFLFPLMVMMSFTYTAVSTVRFVGREKELQLKESMKIMGLPTWLHWTAWFLKQFLFLIFTIAIVVLILKMEWYTSEAGLTGYSIFTLTPWTVLFFYLALYVACTIFFAFMMSGFFAKASTGALFTSVFWFLAYLPAFFLTVESGASVLGRLLVCLSLNSAMAVGFQKILASEAAGTGMQWSEFFSPLSDDDDFLFGYVIVMMAFDCLLYMLLALYIEKVFPGAYGVPRPWYFPLDPSFWMPRNFLMKDSLYVKEETYKVVCEEDPVGLEKGVEIENLTKVYKGNKAVDNLNLNIYMGQITVLLGHNGAGKTTTISMLTGTTPPTRGAARLAGADVATQSAAARRSLGLCPQHNVLFTELTVREHLLFFSRLKGLRGAELERHVRDVIEKLELVEKTDTQAGRLSGGQQRRLNVGVALCGSPRVMLLDEPTSGMDPASRRALWDLLQREKKGRAMILTTHFMDEADILGDRIAIMSGGRLQCVGSPFFLKQQYGSGYQLVVVKTDRCRASACTEMLQRHIPQVTLHSDRGSELQYTVPAEHSQKFQPMLLELEQRQLELGVTSYGLTPSTLEDVFMSVGADDRGKPEESVDTGESYGSEGNISSESATSDESQLAEGRVRGLSLLRNHVLAMWMKRGVSTLRDWKMSLLQLCIPVVITAASVLIVQSATTSAPSAEQRPLAITHGYLQSETLLSREGALAADSASQRSYDAYRNQFLELAASGATVNDIGDESLVAYYMNRASDSAEMARMRRRVMIGATFTSTGATAWFSNFGYHDVAVSLSTLHNALLKAYVPSGAIHVANHPLQVTTDDQTNMQLLHSILAMQLANSVGTIMAILSSLFVIFYIKERVSRAKLLQKASGIQPAVLWLAVAVYDWLWFIITCCGCIAVFAVLQVQGLDTAPQIGRSYVIFLVYGAAMLPLQYLASLVFTGSASGFVIVYFINTLFGTIGSMIVDALRTPGLSTQAMADTLESILQFVPLYSLVTAFRQLASLGITEQYCYEVCEGLESALQLQHCSLSTVCQMGVSMCCVEENAHFQWESPGMLKSLVVMIISGVAFWIILMAIEYSLIKNIISKVPPIPALKWRSRQPPPLDERADDSDVAEEARSVAAVPRAERTNYNLLVRGLSKYYGDQLAVNQVSFAVKSGECFGLLGVNGAGKTSTFKMLTGDVGISCGNAYIRGNSVKTNIKAVHRDIGYCPQFNALFDDMTGRETLRLYALLRGLQSTQSDRLTNDLASRLHFLRHIDKQVKHYSGGNKRKLSAAIALMGDASVIYLDEPTTGVDPGAKRQVWRCVRHAAGRGRSVLLTSHSMEECEALCTRLAVMVNGRFRCLGSVQHLKNKFSQGYILTIKLKPVVEGDNATQKVDEVKIYVTQTFPGAKLTEAYQGLLTYYLPHDSGTWSHMFGRMESARHMMEDYTISQTTLEQVFLQFTKFQRESLQ